MFVKDTPAASDLFMGLEVSAGNIVLGTKEEALDTLFALVLKRTKNKRSLAPFSLISYHS